MFLALSYQKIVMLTPKLTEVFVQKIILRFVFLTLFISCGDIKTPPLADIERVEPETLEPGDIFRIYGKGFVEGSVEVVLDGFITSHSNIPGKQRIVRFRGKAVSEQVVEVILSSRLLGENITEPSTFKGSIEIYFQIQSNTRIFAKKESVELELNPGGAGVAASAKRKRKADEYLSSIGIRLVDSKDVDGFVVAEVFEGSTAANAGIVFGDRLFAIDNRNITKYTDLAEIKTSQPHFLDIVTRQGLVKRLSLKTSISGYFDRDELAAVLLSSIVLGLFLAMAVPANRYVFRQLHRVFNPYDWTFGIGLVSIYLCLIPASALFIDSGLLLWLILFLSHAVGIVFLLIKSPIKNMKCILRLFAVPIIVAASAYLSLAAGPTEITSTQTALPFGVNLLASPFTVLLGITSLFLIQNLSFSASEHGPVAWCFFYLGNAALASTVTICLLGGWNIPFVTVSTETSGALWNIASCLVFLIKTWIVILISKRIVQVGKQERRQVKKREETILSSVLLIVFGGACVFYEAIPISDILRAAGQILAVGLCSTLFAGYLALELKNAFVMEGISPNIRRV